ncbi:hypothetical protein Q7344_10320 [Glaesserella parasuis]|nr:hypothetical protein [Glaesserella parasuis]
MMLFLLSILLAYWFQKEMQHFPMRINQQTYQDYNLLVQSPLSLTTLSQILCKHPFQLNGDRLGDHQNQS